MAENWQLQKRCAALIAAKGSAGEFANEGGLLDDDMRYISVRGCLEQDGGLGSVLWTWIESAGYIPFSGIYANFVVFECDSEARGFARRAGCNGHNVDLLKA